MDTYLPFFESRQVTITYNSETNWLEVFWVDYPKEEDVKEGSYKILDAIEEYKVSQLLVSHQEIKGTWTNINEWVRTEWSPKAVQAGIQNIAIVYSEDVFAKFALNDMVKNANSDFLSIFGTLEDAKEWLQGK